MPGFMLFESASSMFEQFSQRRVGVCTRCEPCCFFVEFVVFLQILFLDSGFGFAKEESSCLGVLRSDISVSIKTDRKYVCAYVCQCMSVWCNTRQRP